MPVLIISSKTDIGLKFFGLKALHLKASVKYILYTNTISVAKNHGIGGMVLEVRQYRKILLSVAADTFYQILTVFIIVSIEPFLDCSLNKNSYL